MKIYLHFFGELTLSSQYASQFLSTVSCVAKKEHKVYPSIYLSIYICIYIYIYIYMYIYIYIYIYINVSIYIMLSYIWFKVHPIQATVQRSIVFQFKIIIVFLIYRGEDSAKTGLLKQVHSNLVIQNRSARKKKR